jgi:hypothetical protein
MSLANDTCENRSSLKLQKMLCSVHKKSQGSSVSFIEHLKKEKNADFCVIRIAARMVQFQRTETLQLPNFLDLKDRKNLKASQLGGLD